jgi:hypothetical protein
MMDVLEHAAVRGMPELSGMRVAYLGPIRNPEQCGNFAGLLDAAGMECFTIASSESSEVYAMSLPGIPRAASRLAGKGLRVVSQVAGTVSRGYVESVVDVIDRQRLTHVVAFWGTGPIADILAIKKARPRVKVIWNVLCHPIALSSAGVTWQNWIAGRCVAACDGVIYPSEAMKSYFERDVSRAARTPSLVWAPRLLRRYFPRRRLAPCPDVPNLLFLGRVDWSSRLAQKSDDISGFLRELLRQGIHVYHASTPESDFRQEFPHHQHVFEYQPLEKITEFATQFDASLVINNLENSRNERFDLTVPDRLVATVAAGIPVALPATGYRACEEYLRNYPALMVFQSADDLAAQLRDRERVAALRQKAASNNEDYQAERYLTAFLQFLVRC